MTYGIKVKIDKSGYLWLMNLSDNSFKPKLFNTKDQAVAWAKASGFKNYKVELYNHKDK